VPVCALGFHDAQGVRGSSPLRPTTNFAGGIAGHVGRTVGTLWRTRTAGRRARHFDPRSRPARSLLEVDEDQQLPSLAIVLAQVVAERDTMNAHAESLDGKAGVVLGFSGVLVGLGATAQITVSGTLIFEIGLAVAVVAAILAAWAFFPRRYPVLEVERRQSNLTAPEAETRLELLDTQIVMVEEAAALVKQKGWRVRAAVGSLAIAAALVVAGILAAMGGRPHA